MRILLRVLAALVILPLLTVANYPAPELIKNKFGSIGPANPEVARQIEYAAKHYAEPNVYEFGYLGNVDCANFVSQTLLARGWKMDYYWWQDPTAWEGYQYSSAWVSSTALNEYMLNNPQLAKPLSVGQERYVQVGDIVQFDWDASGDRDHTAVVSGIRLIGGERELLLAAHSEGMYDYPMSAELRRAPKETKVYYWRILNTADKPGYFQPDATSLAPVGLNARSYLNTRIHWMELPTPPPLVTN